MKLFFVDTGYNWIVGQSQKAAWIIIAAVSIYLSWLAIYSNEIRLNSIPADLLINYLYIYLKLDFYVINNSNRFNNIYLNMCYNN